MSMVVAYLRVSTEKQQLENQRHEIKLFAKQNSLQIDLWHEEIVSGTKEEDVRILGEVMSNLSEGDSLIVSEISRLSRTLMDIMTIMARCLRKKIVVYCIKEQFVLTDSMSSKILLFAFGVTAEVERSLISIRTKEALDRKKAEGVILGRPVGTTDKLKVLKENQDKIFQLLENNVSKVKIATDFGVSRPTLYRFLNQINTRGNE